jgi:hypothetical protein
LSRASLTQDERDLIALVFREIKSAAASGQVKQLRFFDEWQAEDYERVNSVLWKIEDVDSLDKPFQTGTATRLWK